MIAQSMLELVGYTPLVRVRADWPEHERRCWGCGSSGATSGDSGEDGAAQPRREREGPHRLAMIEDAERARAPRRGGTGGRADERQHRHRARAWSAR